jgi:hypothetical protein
MLSQARDVCHQSTGDDPEATKAQAQSLRWEPPSIRCCWLQILCAHTNNMMVQGTRSSGLHYCQSPLVTTMHSRGSLPAERQASRRTACTLHVLNISSFNPLTVWVLSHNAHVQSTTRPHCHQPTKQAHHQLPPVNLLTCSCSQHQQAYCEA